MTLPSYFIFLLIPFIFIGITLYITRGQLRNTQARVRLDRLAYYNAFFFFFTVSAVIENLLDRGSGHIRVVFDSPFYFMARLYAASAFYFLYRANHTFLAKPISPRILFLARIVIVSGIVEVAMGLLAPRLPAVSLSPFVIQTLDLFRQATILAIFALEFVGLALTFWVLRQLCVMEGALTARLRFTFGIAALIVGMFLNYLTMLNYWVLRVTSGQTFSMDFITFIRLSGAVLVVLAFAPKPFLRGIARLYLWVASLTSLLQLAYLLRQYWRYTAPLPWGLPPWSQWILHPEFACRWYVVDILDRQNLITLKKIQARTRFEQALFKVADSNATEREEIFLVRKARQIAWLKFLSILQPAQLQESF